MLDTHIYLWWLTDSRYLSKKAKNWIKEADEVYISSASIWEAGIKIRLGKLDADLNELVEAIETEGFIQLPITFKHAQAVSDLIDHHKDPFDRMLIAQALCEPLRFLTADKNLKEYSELIELM